MKNIYILPGWAYNLDKWNGFVSQLNSAGFDPVVLKIPGLHSKIDRPWDIDDYVNWLNTKIISKNDVTLLGHSNGGRFAMSYCVKYPEKVNNLILIDSAGIYHNELPLRVKRIIFKYLSKAGKKVTKSEKLKTLLYKFARESDYNQASSVMKKTMQNLINHDLTNILSKIKTKTLIIWGEDDKTTLATDGVLINKKIKDSRLEIIQNARHSPQFTHSKKVVEVIRKFLI